MHYNGAVALMSKLSPTT